jgi:hypothetical protein
MDTSWRLSQSGQSDYYWEEGAVGDLVLTRFNE